MNYNKINNLLGWLSFGIAAVTYALTLEPTASFWDCGEFLSAAYKLQVVHQPGAPLFLMIGKLFSLLSFGDTTRVAYWVNMSSAIASATTIMFLFWTITLLVRKVIVAKGEVPNTIQQWEIFGAGFVGALAYAFSDTFWFSAVEAEVYALSSLITAVVFWAILKWEAHADEKYADRWIIFIAYVIGLSIGIHLLSLLIIPVIACVYYFRKTPHATNKGILIAFSVGVLILGFIQYGIIQKMIALAAGVDYVFVNSLNLGFGTGALVFALLLIVGLYIGIRYSHQKGKPILNLALISLVFIIFGYCSFVMIVVRAQAAPNLNNTEPTDAYSLLSYLNREQYGTAPLFYGQYFDAELVEQKIDGENYRKGDKKYELAGYKYKNIYDHNTLFPRMHNNDPSDVRFYRGWMRLTENEKPTFAHNLGFFFSWQVGEMYMRYFMWNFVGRQNDVQGGGGDYASGNWISGIKFLDQLRLGNTEYEAKSITENKAHNQLYFLPLILGILGAYWHFKRYQKDAGVVGLLFFFTGLAIVLYLNQDPNQPRERDYAYVGSFYAFSIWIGMGVLMLAQGLKRVLSAKNAVVVATIGAFLAAPVLMAKEEWNDHDRSGKYMTRDMAANYLNSCASNAILFTYGDNDTYPLWYAQEVENIRPDVRVVNLSLLGTDWYIRQMKKKMNESAGLPILMPDSKFVQGTRDVIYYQDAQIKEDAELKNVFDFIISDDERDQIDFTGEGVFENYLPTKNLKISILADKIIKTKTLPSTYKDKILKELKWRYPRSVITKTELAMFDMLAHNDWQRPVYFANTVPDEQYIGLDKYLYNEGFAKRLLPIIREARDTTEAELEQTNTDVMYHNMMQKFKFGNIKKCPYIDSESQRMINSLENSFLNLIQNLLAEGKKKQAYQALEKYRKEMPEDYFSIYSAYFRVQFAEAYYDVEKPLIANQIMQKTLDYITDELRYYATAHPLSYNQHTSDLKSGMYLLQNMSDLAKENHQLKLGKQIDSKFYGISRFFPRGEE